jgi:hypothetical protein
MLSTTYVEYLMFTTSRSKKISGLQTAKVRFQIPRIIVLSFRLWVHEISRKPRDAELITDDTEQSLRPLSAKYVRVTLARILSLKHFEALRI